MSFIKYMQNLGIRKIGAKNIKLKNLHSFEGVRNLLASILHLKYAVFLYLIQSTKFPVSCIVNFREHVLCYQRGWLWRLFTFEKVLRMAISLMYDTVNLTFYGLGGWAMPNNMAPNHREDTV